MPLQKSVEALRSKFESSWEPMIELMNRARAIEFRIRVIAELQSNKAFSDAKSYDEFNKGARKSPRKKMEKHIKDVFGEEKDQFILIRQCADNLAHADYIPARRRIKQYQEKYSLTSELSEKKAGIVFIEKIKHQDGELAGVGYILGSSDENLILEEFEVFKSQGYQKAAEEMMTHAEQRLKKIVPNLELKYAALVLSRGLKYGERQSKND